VITATLETQGRLDAVNASGLPLPVGNTRGASAVAERLPVPVDDLTGGGEQIPSSFMERKTDGL
jgi:hypothetical protein